VKELVIDGTVNFEFLQENWDDYGVFVLEGSTQSSKTISIVQWLILLAITYPNLFIRCVRADSATHQESTIQDMDFVLSPEMMNLKADVHYKKVQKPWKYTFVNGSVIAFSATNNIAKLHGMKQDILWLNEVMEIAYEAYKQLQRRTPFKASEGKIIMDFNPSYNRHWVFDKVMGGKNVIHHHSTYKANPFLPPDQIQSIEESDPSDPDNVRRGTADQYEWDVYGLGKRGKVKGAVFNLWGLTDWWPDDPMQCMRWGYGQDFGFSVDPTALTECVLHQRGLYLRERIYEREIYITRNQTKPMLPSIQGKYEDMDMSKEVLICADSANPEAIASLCNLGYNVTGVKKGKGSILAGITTMKKFKIYIHQDSQNLQLEMEHYKWKKQSYKDDEDKFVHEPVDKHNHLIDAARYWCMMNLQDTSLLAPTTPGRMRGRKPQVKNRSRQRVRR